MQKAPADKVLVKTVIETFGDTAHEGEAMKLIKELVRYSHSFDNGHPDYVGTITRTAIFNSREIVKLIEKALLNGGRAEMDVPCTTLYDDNSESLETGYPSKDHTERKDDKITLGLRLDDMRLRSPYFYGTYNLE